MLRYVKPIKNLEKFVYKQRNRIKFVMLIDFKLVDSCDVISYCDGTYVIRVVWHYMFDKVKYCSVWEFDKFGMMVVLHTLENHDCVAWYEV